MWSNLFTDCITCFYLIFFCVKSFVHQTTYTKWQGMEYLRLYYFIFSFVFTFTCSELHSGYVSILISFRKQNWCIFHLLGSREGVKGKVSSCPHKVSPSFTEPWVSLERGPWESEEEKEDRRELKSPWTW